MTVEEFMARGVAKPAGASGTGMTVDAFMARGSDGAAVVEPEIEPPVPPRNPLVYQPPAGQSSPSPQPTSQGLAAPLPTPDDPLPAYMQRSPEGLVEVADNAWDSLPKEELRRVAHAVRERQQLESQAGYDPTNPVYQLRRGMDEEGLNFLGRGLRVANTNLASAYQRAVTAGIPGGGSEFNQAADQITEAATINDPWLSRQVNGIVASLGTSVGANAVGGLPAILGTFGVNAYDQALSSAIKGGANEKEARKMALANAGLEVGVMSIFQLLGLGGAEKAVINKFRQWTGREFVKQTVAELAEEEITSIGQMFVSDIDADGITGDDAWAAIRDTAVQTIGTMGLVGGIQKIRSFVENPTTRNAMKADFPPETVRTKQQREAMADRMGAGVEKYRTFREALAAGPSELASGTADFARTIGAGLKGAFTRGGAENQTTAPDAVPQAAEIDPQAPESPVEATVDPTTQEPLADVGAPTGASGEVAEPPFFESLRDLGWSDDQIAGIDPEAAESIIRDQLSPEGAAPVGQPAQPTGQPRLPIGDDPRATIDERFYDEADPAVSPVPPEISESLARQRFSGKAIEAAKDPGYKSRERLVYLTPEQFLSLAEELEGPSPEKTKTVSGVLGRGEKFTSLPMLQFEHDGQGNAKVTSHEGRHRAMALAALGDATIPVILRSTGSKTGDAIRWDQQGDPSNFDYLKQAWPTKLSQENRGPGSIDFPIPDLRLPPATPLSSVAPPEAPASGVTPAPAAEGVEGSDLRARAESVVARNDRAIAQVNRFRRELADAEQLGDAEDIAETKAKLEAAEHEYKVSGGSSTSGVREALKSGDLESVADQIEGFYIPDAPAPPAPKRLGDKTTKPSAKPSEPAPSFSEMMARSDALQKRIDDKHDELEAAGLPFERHDENAELEAMYAERIAGEQSYMGDLVSRSEKAASDAIAKMPEHDVRQFNDKDPKKWAEGKLQADGQFGGPLLRRLIDNHFAVSNEIWRLAEYGTAAFEDKDKTVESLAGELYREWARGNNLDEDGLLSNSSGLTKDAQKELVGWFNDLASNIFDSVAGEVRSGTTPAIPAPAPKRLGDKKPVEQQSPQSTKPPSTRKPKPTDYSPTAGRSWLANAAARSEAKLDTPEKIAAWLEKSFGDQYYWRYLEESGQTLPEAIAKVQQELAAKLKGGEAEQPAAPPKKRLGEKKASVQVTTNTGRKIPAPPQIRTDSNRKSANDLKKQHQWLLDQGIAEAAARGDDYNATWMRGERPGNGGLPPATVDSLNEYLFGETNPTWDATTGERIDSGQEISKPPKVVPKIIRPLVGAKKPKPEAAKAEAAKEAEAAPAKYVRSTPREDRADGIREVWRESMQKAREKEIEAEARKKPIEAQLKKTRRNAYKKRGELQKQIDELNSRATEHRESFNYYQDQLREAEIEDALESSKSPDHTAAGLYELARLRANRENRKANAFTRGRPNEDEQRSRRFAKEQEDQYSNEADKHMLGLMARARKIIDESEVLNNDEARQVEESVVRDFSVTSRRGLEDYVGDAINRQVAARKEMGLPELKHLSDERRQHYRDRIGELTGKDWFTRFEALRDEAMGENKKAADVAAEKAKEQAKLDAIEADKQAAALAIERRRRARDQGRSARFWKELSVRSRAMKGKRGEVEVSITEKDKPERKENRKAEILDDYLAITEYQEMDGGGKEYTLTHIPTGLSISGGTVANLRQLAQLAKETGVKFDEVGSKGSSGNQLLSKVVRAWDNSDLSLLPEGVAAKFVGEVSTKPTGVKADVILDAYDLGMHGPGTLSTAGLTRIKEMVKAAPEFAYDPVFTVNGDKQLVFRDGVTWKFSPSLFNLQPSELTEGQTVGINLEDIGLKQLTGQEAVAQTLKNVGFSKVNAKVDGQVNASWGGQQVMILGEGDKWAVNIGLKETEAHKQATATLKKMHFLAGDKAKPAAATATKESVSDEQPGEKGDAGPSSTSGAASFRKGDATEGEGDKPFDRTAASPSGAILDRLRGIPVPELLQLAKDLLGGKLPIVKKLGEHKLGMFRSAEGAPSLREILLNPKIAQNENQLASVLAHEIGHLIDYLPDATLKRGNILGRIGSLRGFLGKFMAKSPGAEGPLTDEDKKAIRARAKQSMRERVEEEIDEVIRHESPITAKDILNIWNTLEAGKNTPELTDYIKKLSDSQKKDIVFEAIKGRVPEELKRFASVVEEKTGKKIKKVSYKIGDEKNLETLYRKLVEDEIRRRQLLDEKTIRAELIDLTKWWSGDYTNGPKSYQQYRESSRELYAEALSVFLNAPGQIEQRAPNFWRGFTEYLGEKPEVLESYLAVQAMLAGTPEQLAQDRSSRIRGMFTKGDDAIRAAMNARDAAKQSTFESVRQALEQHILERAAPVRRRIGQAKDAGREISDKENAYYILDELNTIDAANHQMLSRIQRDFYEPAIEQGFTVQDIGEYLFLRRIVNERNEILNPLGFTPSAASEQLGQLRKRLGAEKFQRLEGALGIWHDIVFDSVVRAVDAGVYNRKQFENKIKPNKDNYATFAVIHYLENDAHIPAAIMQQIGTLSDVANPLDATHLKTITLNRLIELNIAKSSMRDFLQSSFPDEIDEVPIPQGQREPSKPAPRGMEYMIVLEDGKVHAYAVPSPIAKSFMRHDVGSLAQAARMMESAVYKVFHPLFVTYNPGFQVQNPPRDLRRTHLNLGTIGHRLHNELVSELVASGKTRAEALEAAKSKKITLAQVLKAYWNAKGPAWRRAAGIQDKTIDRLTREHILDVPFVSVDPSVIDEEGATKFLLQQHGLEAGADGKPPGILKRIIGKLGGMVEAVGVFQETLPKVAGEALMSERGVPDRERGFIVRKYTGTPDYKQRGLATAVSNSALMYSKVRWNGMQWDADLATSGDTAAGWWWRRMVWTIMPTTFTKMAAYGLLGPAVGQMMAAIPNYFINNYDLLPLGWLMGDDDDDKGEKKGKTVFLTVAQDDTGRFLKLVYSQMLDMAAEAAGYDGRAASAEKVGKELFGNVLGQTAGTWNPLIDISVKWAQFASGINPRDAYYGSEIVPPTEWTAQGWPATQKMLAWTFDKFGVASTIGHTLTGPTLGSPFESGEETTVETASRSVPGLDRILRISDKGYSESQWADIEAEEQERARFKLGLPKEARDATKLLYRLQRRIDTLSPKEIDQKLLLSKWNQASYLPITKQMQATKNEAEKKRLHDELKKSAANMEQLYLGDVAADRAKMVYFGQGPERQRGEPADKFLARRADWLASRKSARQWLIDHRSSPAVAAAINEADQKQRQRRLGDRRTGG